MTASGVWVYLKSMNSMNPTCFRRHISVVLVLAVSILLCTYLFATQADEATLSGSEDSSSVSQIQDGLTAVPAILFSTLSSPAVIEFHASGSKAVPRGILVTHLDPSRAPPSSLLK